MIIEHTVQPHVMLESCYSHRCLFEFYSLVEVWSDIMSESTFLFSPCASKSTNFCSATESLGYRILPLRDGVESMTTGGAKVGHINMLTFHQLNLVTETTLASASRWHNLGLQ
jgi:hypothetical protein